jgi:bifunctional non-homologous end joining protein LigD
MLAEQHAVLPRGPQWIYEIKLDGYRIEAAVAGPRVKLYSRRANNLAADYPTVTSALSGIRAKSALIDGEVVALDPEGKPSFQALQHRAGVTCPVVYFAFDLLFLNGRDLRGLPLEQRKAQLSRVLTGSSVRISESLEGDPDVIVDVVRGMKLEGVIAKRRSSSYRSARTGDWVKVKLLHQQEFVVAGYKPGVETFESLIAAYHENGVLRFAGKVRNGFNPHLRRELWKRLKPLETDRYPFAELPTRVRAHWGEGLTIEDLTRLRWLKPQLVIQVGFVEWTMHGHLRHPTFIGLRTDKAPRDVVRER